MLAPQFISGPRCKRPAPPRKQRAGTCHQHQPPGGANAQSSDSTNPHGAPLGVYFGLWGEVLAFLFFSDPGGPRLRSAAARKSFPQEGGRQKEKPPTGRKPPARASPIDHYNHALSKFGERLPGHGPSIRDRL